jgi:hypothetical protein
LASIQLQGENTEWKLETPIDEFFKCVVKVVKEELYHDNWKRFIRSNLCEEIMKKFQNDSTVCSPQIIQYFDDKDDYFNHPNIESKDIKFGKLLFEDNFHWKVQNYF